MGDHRFGVRDLSQGAGRFSLGCGLSCPCLSQQPLQALGIVGQEIDRRHRGNRRAQTRRLVVNSMRADSIRRSSAGHLRPPRMLRMPSVDPFEQIAELPRRDHHHAFLRSRPDEASLLQALGVE